MDKRIEISIDQQHKNFKQHIEDETNKRILFSGPFGSGKTYFLNKYFEKEKGYLPFFIYPVNYSVSHNEDIFELLKFDIFFELLRLGVSIPNDNDNISWVFKQHHLLNKGSQWILDILKNSSKIGKNIASIGEKLVELEEAYNKEPNPATTERDKILQFLVKAAKEKGSIIEEDNNTILIQTLLNQLRENKKKPVLIIDDLDRIDPDHIFRLFNVFAAHLDQNEEDNKFGFEKVIFVCDFNNIRNLFRAKYGPQVDFSGYMAKFYNADVYIFDNKSSVEEKISEFLKRIKLSEEKYLQVFPINSPSTTIHETVLYILTGLVKCHAVSLRNIVKMERYSYPFKYYDLYPHTAVHLHNVDFPGLMILDFICWIVGSGQSLLEALEKASESLVYQSITDSGDRDNSQKLAFCITLVMLKESYQARNGSPNDAFHFGNFGSKIIYKVQRGGLRGNGVETIIQEGSQLHNINYFHALLQTVKKLKEYQLLK